MAHDTSLDRSSSSSSNSTASRPLACVRHHEVTVIASSFTGIRQASEQLVLACHVLLKPVVFVCARHKLAD